MVSLLSGSPDQSIVRIKSAFCSKRIVIPVFWIIRKRYIHLIILSRELWTIFKVSSQCMVICLSGSMNTRCSWCCFFWTCHLHVLAMAASSWRRCKLLPGDTVTRGHKSILSHVITRPPEQVNCWQWRKRYCQWLIKSSRWNWTDTLTLV